MTKFVTVRAGHQVEGSVDSLYWLIISLGLGIVINVGYVIVNQKMARQREIRARRQVEKNEMEQDAVVEVCVQPATAEPATEPPPAKAVDAASANVGTDKKKTSGKTGKKSGSNNASNPKESTAKKDPSTNATNKLTQKTQKQPSMGTQKTHLMTGTTMNTQQSMKPGSGSRPKKEKGTVEDQTQNHDQDQSQ
ncbi:unnamed protein product, partial [Mesorhabditis spiculigera]